MNWYYALAQQRHGPVSQDEFVRLVREGTIGPDTLVWRQGMDNWRRYDELPAEERAAIAEAGTGGGEAAASRGTNGGDTAVCAVSGRTLPKSEMLEYNGQWIAAEHREEFFRRLREGHGPVGTPEYAGFWIRVLAKLIDVVVLIVIGTIKDGVLAMMMFGTFRFSQISPAQLERFYSMSLLTGTILGIAYTWFFLARFAATPGKLALDLKVVRADGSPLSAGRILGRYFAEVVSCLAMLIGYLMVAFDREEHRALHDLICDTRVVKNPPR